MCVVVFCTAHFWRLEHVEIDQLEAPIVELRYTDIGTGIKYRVRHHIMGTEVVQGMIMGRADSVQAVEANDVAEPVDTAAEEA